MIIKLSNATEIRLPDSSPFKIEVRPYNEPSHRVYLTIAGMDFVQLFEGKSVESALQFKQLFMKAAAKGDSEFIVSEAAKKLTEGTDLLRPVEQYPDQEQLSP